MPEMIYPRKMKIFQDRVGEKWVTWLGESFDDSFMNSPVKAEGWTIDESAKAFVKELDRFCQNPEHDPIIL